MKATVAKAFDGAPDGELYPRHFVPGEVVGGSLARVAVENGWAVPKGDGKTSAPTIVIPEGWASFGAADTIALARALGADDSVKTKAAAADVIGAEVEKRKAPG